MTDERKRPDETQDGSPLGRHYVSAREVAELAGVSRSAVSRALTPGASISPAMKEKVLAAARELGYEINALARGLLDDRAPIVSLISSSIGSPFMGALLPELTAQLLAMDYAPMLINIGVDAARSDESLRQVIKLRSTAAIILSGSPPDSFVRATWSSGVPVIALNRDEDGLDLIATANADAGRQAFRRLRDAGAGRCVIVSPSRWTAAMRARAHGFKDEAERADVAAPRLILAEAPPQASGTLDYQAGLAAGATLFAESPAPDGIFCLNDHLAFGLSDSARFTYDLTPGRDFSLIGFDDVPMAGWASYRLTTFRQDIPELVQHILATLAERLASPGAAPIRKSVKAILVDRKSIA